MRLNRYLSQCGVGSRRGCEQIILEGRVSINGHTVQELATQVNEGDKVEVDLKPVQPAAGVVVAFHKPKGFICSRGDTHDRATIYAILPPQYQTLHYVGRLDKESEGLLLLTNRGELSQRLTHPSEGVEKEYEVTIDSDFAPEDKLKLLHGMITEEGFAKAERVWVESSRRITVVLKQGLKRQIRLMFYQLGYEVERLLRVRVGGLYLKGIPRGAWKELSEAEVQRYFIKHKERERAVRPAKEKKTDDEGSDNFSSEPVPVAAAPFKLRPGPKSRVPAVRKPKRFSKAAEEIISPAEESERPKRSSAPPKRHFGARPGTSSREKAADADEGETPRRRSSSKSASFKPKRDYSGDRPVRSGRPARSAKPGQSDESRDSEAPRRRSSTKSSFRPKPSGFGARRDDEERPATGKPAFSRSKTKISKPNFKSGNKAPRGSKSSGGGGSSGRPGKR